VTFHGVWVLVKQPATCLTIQKLMLNALARNTTSELAGLSLLIPLMLNVKQGN